MYIFAVLYISKRPCITNPVLPTCLYVVLLYIPHTSRTAGCIDFLPGRIPLPGRATPPPPQPLLGASSSTRWLPRLGCYRALTLVCVVSSLRLTLGLQACRDTESPPEIVSSRLICRPTTIGIVLIFIPILRPISAMLRRLDTLMPIDFIQPGIWMKLRIPHPGLYAISCACYTVVLCKHVTHASHYTPDFRPGSFRNWVECTLQLRKRRYAKARELTG